MIAKCKLRLSYEKQDYRTRLDEIKKSLRYGWLDTLCAEVANSTQYDKEELLEEFLRRCEKETGDLPLEIVDEFIVQALEGKLQ